MSLVIFLTTTASTAPVEGKNEFHFITLCCFGVFFPSGLSCGVKRICCFPEKEIEVESEATEEMEGELSEEEEGRPVCLRN